jgi:hypothetical protein
MLFRFYYVGYSTGYLPPGFRKTPNCYGIYNGSGDCCYLSGVKYDFDFSNDFPPEMDIYYDANVIGCGLLLDTFNKWSIFFTVNGKFMG